MTGPPRAIEALLESLGAEPRFLDSVLGDLAEEFASRAERDGFEHACRWYRREALRAAPHLLRSGWQGARRRGLGHLLGVMVTALTGMLIVEWIVVGILFGVLRTLGLWHAPLRLFAGNPFWQLSMLTLGTGSATFGGYLSAWLDRDAPLFTAFAFGIVWSLLEGVGLAMYGGVLPDWYKFVVPVIILVGTTMGGAVRVTVNARSIERNQH